MSAAVTAQAARELLADYGSQQATMDFLIDQRIDCRTQRDAERLEMLIAAVERTMMP